MTELKQAPIFRIFQLGIESGAEEAFFAVGQENFSRSIAEEKGTLTMFAGTEVGKKQESYVIEVYQDKESYHIHRQSPQFKVFQEFAQSGIRSRVAHSLDAKLLVEKASPLNPTGTYYLRLAKVTLKPASQDAFFDIVGQEMKISVEKEDGVHLLYAGISQEHPDDWYFVEVYDSAEAYERHLASPHFLRYIEESQDLVLEKKGSELENALLYHKGNLSFQNHN